MPDTICIDGTPGEEIVDLSYAARQVTEKLPGWCWKVGTCCVSDDAWVAPDWNDPIHGPRLKVEFATAAFDSIFDAGVDVDRRPPGNVGRALLDAIDLALAALAQRGPVSGDGGDEAAWLETGEKFAASFAESEVEFFQKLEEHIRIVGSCGCVYCDLKIDPDHIIDGKPFHSMRGLGPARYTECSRSAPLPSEKEDAKP